MKRPWLAAGLCLVVVGLGTIGVRHESRAELQRALASLRANLPPDARFEYDHAYPRFFARGAGFDNARFIRGGTVLTARVLTISNPQGYLSTGLSVSRIHAQGVEIRGEVAGKIDDLTIGKLLLPPVTREKHDVTGLPPASQLHFRHGQIHGVALTSASGCTLTIHEASLDNYGHDDGNAGSLHDGHLLCAKESAVAYTLASAFHQPAAPLGIDVTDLRESGIRYARYVGWAEQFTGGTLPDHAALLSDTLETPARTETKGLALSFLNMRLTTDTSEMHRWQEGKSIETRSETRHSILRIDLPVLLALSLPPVTHIDTVTQTISFDTASRVGTIAFNATTPNSFVFEGHIVVNNLENFDGEHLPALVATDLTYHDEGGNLDALLTRIAAQRNQSLGDLKQVIVPSMTLLALKVPGLSALPEFISAPTGRTLTLSFHPPVPLDNQNVIGLVQPLRKDPAMAQAWSSPPILSTTLH
ncbi:hypothetical protein ACFFGF_01390 [Asaia lannensis]|uniref:DUF945 family protein n=1 Tax=Asaia lannensis NBRC 102526 TaxID=1307926 RepID=A0ABT1CCT0_9PROT|nr:hypothetical protein [Asaia lannensis]MCO6158673.1 hypothetical protein [Asaia lannensis NBRC 102526]GBR00497.1 hypothetical protein AA102526_2208 [Asaia lannensis NBRC 102526]